MVEVGGSNPPGPTNKNPAESGVFYRRMNVVEQRRSGSTKREAASV